MKNYSDKHRLPAKTIYCIGDSHADFFSGWNNIGPEYPQTRPSRFPFFQAFRLGPALAYSLPDLGSTTKGREKLFEILGKADRQKVIVMLCFGEIDCRVHLIRQAKLKNVSTKETASECAKRYFSVITEVRNLGFETIVWNAIPSSLYQNSDQDFPTFGTCLERNDVTRLFNKEVERLCRQSGIPFISIFDPLVYKGLTRMEFYMDAIHLSQKAMPLALRALSAETTLVLRETMIERISLWYSDARKNIKRLMKRLDAKVYRLIAGPPVIPPSYQKKREIILSYASRFKTDSFVETGTYLGETIDCLKDSFSKLVSIELDKKLFEQAKKKFSSFGHISILHGDSARALPEVLSSISGKTLFWLDGHYSGSGTAKGDLNTPILKELELIFGHSKNHIVLIDDARCFTGENDYPTLRCLYQLVNDKTNTADFVVENDIIRIVPGGKTYFREPFRNKMSRFYRRMRKIISNHV